MRLDSNQIEKFNKINAVSHDKELSLLKGNLLGKGVGVDKVIAKVADFQVAVPSWALGAGGTRFGRFSFGGEPRALEEKLDDIGLIHKLTRSSGAVSLHIPWDIPQDIKAIKERAASHEIVFDAMNSNTFQDQKDALESYKHGSLSSVDRATRVSAIAHNLEVIEIGKKLGSKSMTIWLADGSNFPGQNNFQRALINTEDSLNDIYRHLPDDWKLLLEYKPYEPNFYSTVIQDWGTSFMLANAIGERAYSLVDLGHHLPNTNIEQIVATLMYKGKLGGFHFNDSKYGDDDLTVGSVNPYTLFLIFNELIYGMQNNPQNPDLAWMIDASHNIKDPLEDLIQSLEAILLAYAQALLVDQKALRNAQQEKDVVRCQELLQDAYRTDVRPILKEARKINGGAMNPLQAYRELGVRQELIKQRGAKTQATGL